MPPQRSIDLAKLSLDGLSVGDAIGEHFLREYPRFTWDAGIPPGPLPWTDDTQMAISIVEELCQNEEIDQDHLAGRFAERFAEDPERGYSPDTYKFLFRIGGGQARRELALSRFPDGSYGNGAAMRVAPLGGFFAGDPKKAAAGAKLSAEITHTHPEGIAGAVAVAVAAALVADDQSLSGEKLLKKILKYLPEGEVTDRIFNSLEIPKEKVIIAIKHLGTGYKISAQDTVPFCLWIAAHYGDDYENALRITMQGMGDCDTTCAIVGGIVSLAVGEVPQYLINCREPL